jgi:hypothetical protein
LTALLARSVSANVGFRCTNFATGQPSAAKENSTTQHNTLAGERLVTAVVESAQSGQTSIGPQQARLTTRLTNQISTLNIPIPLP